MVLRERKLPKPGAVSKLTEYVCPERGPNSRKRVVSPVRPIVMGAI
jgi:hypothetical protein